MAELSPGVRWDDRGEEAIGFVGKEERRGEKPKGRVVVIYYCFLESLLTIL